MDLFVEALLSGKTDRIPDGYDWFAPLIGDWDCDYYDEPEKGRKRHVKGECLLDFLRHHRRQFQMGKRPDQRRRREFSCLRDRRQENRVNDEFVYLTDKLFFNEKNIHFDTVGLCRDGGIGPD